MRDLKTHQDLIRIAIDLCHGKTALARLLTDATNNEVTMQRVNNWAERGDKVPTEFMAPIEQLTEGKVTRKQFCPDNWHVIWPELVEGHKLHPDLIEEASSRKPRKAQHANKVN